MLFWMLSNIESDTGAWSPNLEKKCVRLLDVALSHEILRKIYFVSEPWKNGLDRGVEILSALFFFVKSALVC